jgi:hypothetical protein
MGDWVMLDLYHNNQFRGNFPLDSADARAYPFVIAINN